MHIHLLDKQTVMNNKIGRQPDISRYGKMTFATDVATLTASR